MLVDSHCHLDFDVFDEDREATVARALKVGIGRMVTICTKISRFEPVLAIARGSNVIDCTLGVHPHHVASEGMVAAERLVAGAAAPEVVGIGETGLDYYYDRSPREDQKRSFRNHIAAARTTGLPLIVHTRDADEDMIGMLGGEMGEGAFSGVLHCFSAGRALAEAALDLGLYISFSGIVTFKKSDGLREIVRAVPMEHILVETDAPFLAPAPNRGKRNEPSFVVHTAAAIAGIKGLDTNEVIRRTTDNFFELFQKSAERAQRCA